jgi:hypothetical protein
MLYPENDAAGQARAKAFEQQLQRLGWTLGRDLQIDYHWGATPIGCKPLLRNCCDCRPT